MVRRQLLLASLIAAFVWVPSAIHAQEQQKGMFRLTRQTTEIVEPAFAEALAEVISKDDQLEWQVFVPESYSPQRPAGLIVYVDPDGSGYMPDAWRQVFADHNMIWVSARRTQRRPSEARQIWEGILGSQAIAQDYEIALQRMYVAGSPGTIGTVLNTLLMANEFSGAIYIRDSLYVPGLEADQLQALQRKYHVFISGTNDENKNKVRSDYGKYQNDGITNVKLIFDTKRIDEMPQPEHMDEAVRFLDSRLSR